MNSPSDGLPWPVVLLLALASLGLSLLAARFHQPSEPEDPQ